MLITDKGKTNADIQKEGEILTEMLEIVARRDSLVAMLDEERQRWRSLTCSKAYARKFSSASANNLVDEPLFSQLHGAFLVLFLLLTYALSLHLIDLLYPFVFDFH